MTTTQHPIPRHSISAACELVEDVYGAQAPDRSAGIEHASTAAWTAAELIERLFGTTPGVAAAALASGLAARADRNPPIDCGGGELAYGAWVGGDLACVVEVLG